MALKYRTMKFEHFIFYSPNAHTTNVLKIERLSVYTTKINVIHSCIFLMSYILYNNIIVSHISCDCNCIA